MAGYQTYLGSFRSPGATGSLAYTGLGFRPKGLLVWSANTAQTPPEFNDYLYWSLGLTDGTNHLAVTSLSFDAQGTSDMSQGLDTTALIIAENNAGSTQHRATLTSFDADGFTLNWTNIFSTEQRHYNFIAIGGDDVSVKVGEFNSNTATGAQAFSGLSFRPSGVIFAPIQNAGTSEDRLTYPAMGWADGANQGTSYVFSQDGAAVAVTKRYQRPDKCVALGSVADGSVLAEASLTSFDANGFTLNWSTAPAAALRVFYLAFTGIPFTVGALTQPAASGSQATTGIGFPPGSVLLQSVNAAASASVQNGNDFSLGGGSAARSRAVWMADKNGADPMESARYYSQTLAYAAGSVNATGPSSSLLASAALASLDEDGFTLTHAADGIQREILFAAFGEEISDDTPPHYEITIGEETGINPLRATFKIQETLDGPDTMIADIESLEEPFFRPSLGQTVFVTENGVRVFGGYVTGLRERALSGPNADDLVVEVQATSYELNAKRRKITRSFSAGSPAETIGDAFAALVDEYYGDVGVTLHPDQVAGPELGYVAFEREGGDTVNKQLADSVGYLQSIDFENRLRAWAPGDIAAPHNYDEDTNPELFEGDIEVERQLQNGYANRVILVGEPIAVPDFQDDFTGDGVTEDWPLTYKVGGPYPYFVAGAVAFGIVFYPATGTTESIGGVEGPQLWAYDPIAQTIRRKAGPVANGVDFVFPYHGLFIPEATVEDAGEIETYGLYEYEEEVTSITTDLSAQGYAAAILAQKLASKDEIVTIKTRELGYHPGQTMGIASPKYVLTGDFLLTQVDTTADADVRLLRTITAAKSLNNEHDFRTNLRRWEGQSVNGSETGTSSTTSSAGAGMGLHATNHRLGGIDAIKLDDLATPDDNTDLNVSTSRHGLTPKITGSDGDVLTKSGAAAVWSAASATVADDSVTNAKLANMAQSTIKGRAVGAGTGDPTDLTGTQATAILDNMVGDSGAGGTKGLVPAPASGDTAAGRFLKADGSWAAPSGTGAPADAEYVVETASSGLSAEVVLGTTVITTATQASRQAAAKAGRLFLPSDGLYAWRDTGAAWAPWGPIFPMVEPVSGDYAWINQGSASLNTTPGGIYLLAPATGAATPSVVLRKKAAPSTPYTITVAFIPQLTTASGLSVGVGWRQSSDGKLIYIALDIGGAALNVYKFTSPTAFSATYAGVAILAVWPLFVRFTDNGTNRIVSWSRDGQNFIQIHSVGRTDFLTADEIWFGAQAQLASGSAAMTLLSWAQT